MGQILKTSVLFVGVLLAQLKLADYIRLGEIRPDFILVFLVFLSSRYGRITGILGGFGAGLIQDLGGALSILGANTLAKPIVGYTLGTLNGTATVWTPRIMNLYVYGALFVHALIFQTAMSLGLQMSMGMLVNRIVLETFISSTLVTGLRYMVPLIPARP